MGSLQNEWPCSAESYQLLSPIGFGHFGIVWKGEVKAGSHKGEHVAIKKIDLERAADAKIDEIRKNMLLLNLLNHRNILSYKITFCYKQEIWLVFEILGAGSIEKIIAAHYPNGIHDQILIATILKETLQGLSYLHQNQQIHRDIKGANILIGDDGCIKISDFGVTAKLKKHKKRNTFTGSPCWMAPEVLDQDGTTGYDEKADIWSLGITALELAHGKPPNHELTTMKLIITVINKEPPKLDKQTYWDESFYDFIGSCLQKDPKKRKSALELLKCPFISKAKGKDYVKLQLLKNLASLEERVDQQTKRLAAEQLIQPSPKKTICLDFDFTPKLAETESTDDEKLDINQRYTKEVPLPDIVEIRKNRSMPIVTYSKSQMPSLTNVQADLLNNESKGLTTSISNDRLNELIYSQGKSKFFPELSKDCQYYSSTQKIKFIKGDDNVDEFGNLNEDES